MTARDFVAPRSDVDPRSPALKAQGVRIRADRVGDDGLVDIYDLASERWLRRSPVDCREMIAVGSASLDSPPPPQVGEPGD